MEIFFIGFVSEDVSDSKLAHKKDNFPLFFKNCLHLNVLKIETL